MGGRGGGSGDEEGSLSTFSGGGSWRGEGRKNSRDSRRFTVRKKVRGLAKAGASRGSVQRCERRKSLKEAL
jgi:hypothetical protein